MGRHLRTSALLLVLSGGAAASAKDLAVIVNPANPVESLSTADLREILLMQRQHWPAGGRIYLLLPEGGTPGKAVLLDRVLKMKDRELKRHYLAKLYSGEISSFPRIAESSAAARRTVARVANAIALLEATALDDSVKVVKIDGRGPGDAGYVLTASRSARREQR